MLTDVEAPADDDDHENVMQIGSNALLVSHSLVDVCLRHVCEYKVYFSSNLYNFIMQNDMQNILYARMFCISLFVLSQ